VIAPHLLETLEKRAIGGDLLDQHPAVPFLRERPVGFVDAEMVEDCPDILSFSRSGLQHNVLKKLRQGKHPVEHVLDLHGLTVAEASRELLEFLGECEAVGIRHAIIIHGKGFRSREKPVIKPMVNRWLRATEKVLAFHTALPKDGGSGAVYVLLKRERSSLSEIIKSMTI